MAILSPCPGCGTTCPLPPGTFTGTAVFLYALSHAVPHPKSNPKSAYPSQKRPYPAAYPKNSAQIPGKKEKKQKQKKGRRNQSVPYETSACTEYALGFINCSVTGAAGPPLPCHGISVIFRLAQLVFPIGSSPFPLYILLSFWKRLGIAARSIPNGVSPCRCHIL